MVNNLAWGGRYGQNQSWVIWEFQHKFIFEFDNLIEPMVQTKNGDSTKHELTRHYNVSIGNLWSS